jgi:hypothetical protein
MLDAGIKVVLLAILVMGESLAESAIPAGGAGIAAASRVPQQVLRVGVGDTVQELLQQNPYLGTLQMHRGSDVRISVAGDSRLEYRDPIIALDIDCVSSVYLDSGQRFSGVEFVGAKLCATSIGRWAPAISLANDVLRQLAARNPVATDFRHFYSTASEGDLVRIGGEAWRRFSHDSSRLITPEQAAEKFSKEAARGDDEVVSGVRRSTEAFLGVFVSDYVIFEIGISKVGDLGGANLSESDRRRMRYEVTLGFRLRNDVDASKMRSGERRIER